MDRRQQKTRAAIFKAFRKLLERKKYRNITVQELIDEANIGRSTFYAHFETKDELLRAMCTDIFSHVFSDDLSSEKTHDFSANKNKLEDRLTHILHHLRDNKKNIRGILSCESADLFMSYFKGYLAELFAGLLNPSQQIPSDFLLDHFVGSYSEMVRWWINNNVDYTPEEAIRFYLEVSTIDRFLSDRTTI